MEPSIVGTMAMFDVINPSRSFSVETGRLRLIVAHNVRYGIRATWRTVACSRCFRWFSRLDKKPNFLLPKYT